MGRYSDEQIDEILKELEQLDQTPQSRALPAEQPRPRSWRRELLSLAGAVLPALLVVFVLFGLVFRFVLVDGSSMEPTLSDGDRLIMYCLDDTPESGDVVILSDDTGLGIPLIKRVIAAGGQTLDISPEGRVTVDGEPLYEPYAVEQMKDTGAYDYPLTIPEGQLFVMGDNRNHSTDSRSPEVGLVDERKVLGKAVFRLFPLGRMGPVS
ncbi:MAG TPA: signal peptidase I [Candidatus Merdivicinus intestinigallinarum]|nr:signal peptidase I [Candidatus Merdivicinus intestinigallinarum]